MEEFPQIAALQSFEVTLRESKFMFSFASSCDLQLGSYFAAQWMMRWHRWCCPTHSDAGELSANVYIILTNRKFSSDYKMYLKKFNACSTC